VFKLKYATLTFLPTPADPYAYIYAKKKLDQDMHWYEKNIMGSGPFKLTEYQVGQSIKGERNPITIIQASPTLTALWRSSRQNNRCVRTPSGRTAQPWSSGRYRPGRTDLALQRIFDVLMALAERSSVPACRTLLSPSPFR